MPKKQTDGEFFVKRYLKDPERYVREVLGVQVVEPWQHDVLTDLANGVQRIACGTGHGCGKTALASWVIHWFNATRPNPQTVVTANTENQLRSKTWRELAKWNRAAKNKDWFEHTATRFYLKSAPDTWFASAIPWTENRSEAFAGTHEKHILYVFDEASAIPPIIWEVSEGAMTTEGAIWLVFGNRTKNTGTFAECWGKFRHRWKTYCVDSRQVSISDKKQIQDWMDDYGEDSDFFKVRVRGLAPNVGVDQFISVADVRECIKYSVQGHGDHPLVMGIDLSRKGADQNAVAIRQGRAVSPLIRWHEEDTTKTISRIVDLIAEHEPDAIFVDGGSIGGPIIDRLRQLVSNFDIIEVNFGGQATNKERYLNKRSEIWGKMREAIRARVSLPDDQTLVDDLTGVEAWYTGKEQLQLESKDDMRARGLASPDSGDALALTYAHPVLKTRKEKPPTQYIEVGGYDPGGSWMT